MGAYSRSAVIRGWALIRINTVYCLTLRFWFSFLMAWQWKTAIRTSSWLASLAWRFCWAHYPQKRSLTFAHFGLFARPTKTAMLRRIPADRFWGLFSKPPTQAFLGELVFQPSPGGMKNELPLKRLRGRLLFSRIAQSPTLESNNAHNPGNKNVSYRSS